MRENGKWDAFIFLNIDLLPKSLQENYFTYPVNFEIYFYISNFF